MVLDVILVFLGVVLVVLEVVLQLLLLQLLLLQLRVLLKLPSPLGEGFLSCFSSPGLGFGRSLEEMNRTDVPHLPI